MNYTEKELGWVCFHCDERFTTVGGARDHFGVDKGYQPGCFLKVSLGDERGWQMELRKAEQRAEEQMERALQAERELEAAECSISSLSAEMSGYKPFKKCNSMQDVFNVYDYMEGLKLAAEYREKMLVELINNEDYTVMWNDDGTWFLRKDKTVVQNPAPAMTGE